MTAPVAAPAPTPAGVEGPSAQPLRLTLPDAEPARLRALDGAWWPRSRSLIAELPALIVELHHRGTRITRVAYNPDSWDATPRKLQADGRVVRLGWFRTLAPQLVSLTGSSSNTRIDLLVVPPDTPGDVATRMMTQGTGYVTLTNALRALAQAAAAVVLPSGPRTAGHAVLLSEERWESEGGRLHC